MKPLTRSPKRAYRSRKWTDTYEKGRFCMVPCKILDRYAHLMHSASALRTVFSNLFGKKSVYSVKI